MWPTQHKGQERSTMGYRDFCGLIGNFRRIGNTVLLHEECGIR